MFASFLFLAAATLKGHVDATPAKFLGETVVYIKTAPAGAPAAKSTTVEMDQKGMKFVPHVMAITVGDTVKFLNSDSVIHNVYAQEPENYVLAPFNTGQSATHTFTKPGAYAQLCSFHPEMLAYIFVAPTRYFAVVDDKGDFTIAGLPDGKYEISIWNSHLKADDQSVAVAGAPVSVSFSLKR